MKQESSGKPILRANLSEIHPPDASDHNRRRWDRLVRILLDGGVVLLPTDTIYGLHARWDDPHAAGCILALKGKSEGVPLLSLIGSSQMLDFAAPTRPPSAERLIQSHWPGSLTVVLPAGPRAPSALVLDGGIALRWPKDPFLTDLVRAVGVPLVSTSANPSGAPPLTQPDEIPASWNHQLDAIVEGGRRSGPASTLIRIKADGGVAVLREGSLKLGPGDLDPV
jgi:L-threonylcarbamoyladenylate synthase